MTTTNEKIQLLNANEGVGNVRMARWKYDIYRRAILAAIPDDEAGVPFKELPDRVRALLPADQLDRLGSVSWHTTSVKLDLEARGMVRRLPGSKPQRLRRVEAGDGA